jgi:hypothetical protein
MINDLSRSVRMLQGYAVLLTAAIVALGVVEWRRATATAANRFTEIDAERVNIVEPDGTIRLVLSDKARFPGLILKRKEYPHPRGTAGLLFFNDEGTEDGGLAYTGAHTDSGTIADGELMFDQYDQDQTVGIEYSDERGQRVAGLHVWDRSDTLSIAAMIARLQTIRAMPEGPQRTRALQALHAASGATRLFAGKTADHSAVVALSDPQGRPRLRLSVDKTGNARIELLDSTGRVTTVVPSH